jgi:hypothetical protein
VLVTWSGPGGHYGTSFPSDDASGNVAVCPGSVEGGRASLTCRATPGVHTYTVIVRDANGAIVAQRSATLTIS